MAGGSLGAMTSPLLVTRDETLLDELLRLAAAAGVTPDVAHDAVACLRGWSTAPLVLVGADVAAEVARTRPARRAGVHVVSWGEEPDDLYRTALAIGAENVAELPASGEWVVESLTDLGEDRPADGLVVGVLGGSGGAGATTFACAVGQVAARSGPAVVVDTDPRGPGLDRVLGLDGGSGVRWDDLCQTTGRLSARALRESLPRKGSLGVLTWPPGAVGGLQAFAVREALSAARRGHDTVVLDLPRARDPVIDEVAARCDRVLVLVVPSLSGVAAAARTCAGFPDRSQLGLVVRGLGPDSRELTRLCGAPVLVRMADQRGLSEAVDLGLGPVRSRRGPLARAAREVLARLAGHEAAA